MTTSTSARNVVALLAVLATLLAVAGLWWVGERRIEHLKSPITLSLSTDDQLWAGLGGVLHRFDTSGRRLERVTLRELGLPEPLSHLHAVRTDDLLASAGVPTRLFRCVPSQHVCRAADAGYIAAFGRFELAVWIGANADGSRVVVSDNLAHRVAVLDAQGALLAHARGLNASLWDPGQPVWVGNDTIWLAGADMKRIERFTFDGRVVAPTGDAVPTPALHPLLRGRTWPMALTPVGDGRWWAVVQYNMMEPGGLLRFVEGGDFDREARLPAGADLTTVARLGDRLVVADVSRPALWQLDLDGGDALPFGSDDFRAELVAFGATQARLDLLRRLLIAALAVLPLMALVALYLMGAKVSGGSRFLRPDFRAPVARMSREPVEIRTTDAWRRRLRWMAALMATSVAVAIPLLMYLAWRRGLPLWSGASFALVVALLLPVIWWRLRERAGQRLLVHDGTISVQSPRGEVARAMLSECWCDGRAMLVGTLRVALYVGQEPVFDRLALQAHVLGLLPHERWVSGGELQFAQMRAAWQRNPVHCLLSGLLLLVSIGAAIIHFVIL